uniref:Uncharacterized protein n=1 Tax=Magallana gigas TaxID=29159 RepID=K1RLA2_MAGGI
MAVCVRRDHVWIGLHATSQGGNLHHFWPDCDQLTYTDFNPWQNSSDDQKEGCVMFHPSSPSYSVVDCSSSLPYICENRETAVIDWIRYTSVASSVPPSDACSVTSHSSLLTTPTVLYASSESLITSAESTLTTLYPSTTPPSSSSTATLSTPHLQTVTGSIHSSPVMSCTHTLTGSVYGGLLSVLDLVELVPVIDDGGSDTGRVRETTPAKRHRQVGVRVVPFHPPRPAGGVSGQIHFRVTAGKSCR